MKLLSYIHFAWKTLWRKKSRVVLSTLSICIAVMSLLFFFGLRHGYTQNMSQSIQNFGAHLIAMPKGCPYEASSVILQGGILPKQLPQDTLQKIQNLPNVQYAYATLSGMIPSVQKKGELDRITGITKGIEHMKNSWRDISNTDMFFSDEKNSNKYLILGSEKAEVLKVSAGDTIQLGPEHSSFIVLAVLPPSENQEDTSIFVSLPIAQEWFRQDGWVSSVSVTLEDISKAEETIIAIESIEDVQVLTMNELLQMVLEYIDMLQWLIVGILLIAMMASFLQIVNTITISVTDQIREIVVLKAFGATNTQMSLWILFQSLLLGFLGVLLGIALTFLFIPVYELMIPYLIPTITTGSIFLLSGLDISFTIGITLLMTVLACIHPLFIMMKQSPSTAFARKPL
ncbi:MAG TPA: ABC transporter permease [Caldisericia bacterium]|nr:ABC transporter permease [Caldisericia bacterium]HXK51182.1 ABC transporter permease [Caldisericia bacterium]